MKVLTKIGLAEIRGVGLASSFWPWTSAPPRWGGLLLPQILFILHVQAQPGCRGGLDGPWWSGSGLCFTTDNHQVMTFNSSWATGIRINASRSQTTVLLVRDAVPSLAWGRDLSLSGGQVLRVLFPSKGRMEQLSQNSSVWLHIGATWCVGAPSLLPWAYRQSWWPKHLWLHPWGHELCSKRHFPAENLLRREFIWQNSRSKVTSESHPDIKATRSILTSQDNVYLQEHNPWCILIIPSTVKPAKHLNRLDFYLFISAHFSWEHIPYLEVPIWVLSIFY